MYHKKYFPLIRIILFFLNLRTNSLGENRSINFSVKKNPLSSIEQAPGGRNVVKMLWFGYQSFWIYNQRPTCKRRFLVPGGLDQLEEDGGRVDIPGVLHRPEEHLKAVVVLARVHHRVHQPLDDVGWQLGKNKLVRSPSGPGFDSRHSQELFSWCCWDLLTALVRAVDRG